MPESRLRYGISALDVSYKDHAVNDELMVDGKNGSMIYKRSDGQIVIPSSPYDRDSLINAIMKIFDTHKKVDILDTDYLVYNTLTLNEKIDLLASGKQAIDTPVVVSSDKLMSGVFARVRGNSVTNSVASYLASRSSKDESSTTPEVVCEFTVTELGTGTERQITIESKFDSLGYCELYGVDGPAEGCEGYQIKLTSISFPLLKSVYDTLGDQDRSLLSELNFGNMKFEPSEIDIIYYTSDGKNATIYSKTNNLKLNYVLPAIETDHEDFIVSSSKPSHRCMWAKVVE